MPVSRTQNELLEKAVGKDAVTVEVGHAVVGPDKYVAAYHSRRIEKALFKAERAVISALKDEVLVDAELRMEFISDPATPDVKRAEYEPHTEGGFEGTD